MDLGSPEPHGVAAVQAQFAVTMTDRSAESHALADMLGTKTRPAQHSVWQGVHCMSRDICQCPCVYVFRDETDHLGRKLDWGSWAICSDDFAYQGARVSSQAAC